VAHGAARRERIERAVNRAIRHSRPAGRGAQRIAAEPRLLSQGTWAAETGQHRRAVEDHAV
jgi:hypothetical protein